MSAVGWLEDSLRTRLAHDRPVGLVGVFWRFLDAGRFRGEIQTIPAMVNA
jgi:hypothetical protein